VSARTVPEGLGRGLNLRHFIPPRGGVRILGVMGGTRSTRLYLIFPHAEKHDQSLMMMALERFNDFPFKQTRLVTADIRASFRGSSKVSLGQVEVQ